MRTTGGGSLIRQGVNRNTVQVGTFLVVEGYRAKDGTKKILEKPPTGAGSRQ